MTGASALQHVILNGHQSVAIDGRRRIWTAPIVRISSKVVTTDSGCQEWTGYLTPKGYGQTSVNGKLYQVHRVVWIAHHGDIPVDMCVCHRCDNRRCCNIDHLFLGTVADNMADMVSKGRGPRRYNEQNPRTKLSKSDVQAIRSAHAAGVTQRSLAKVYGVNSGHVSRICNLKRREPA